jgi:RNAse (barnase) inhibitor barstar
LWRCSDGLFFEVPPLASDALPTTLHPLLENVLQTVDNFEISCLGAPFSWVEKLRSRMGRNLDCMADVLMEMMAVPIRTSAPCDFCDFQPYQEVKTACSTILLKLAANGLQHVFREVGGAL